jgi:hypothetical protein
MLDDAQPDGRTLSVEDGNRPMAHDLEEEEDE